MSRVTAIICGVLLFGLGLFFGMVGSFIRTLSPDTPQAPKSAARAVPAVNPPQRAAQTKSSAVKQPPPAVESALSQALAMVAVALAEQPAAPAPPVAVAPPPAAPVDITTNVPEQHALDALMSDTANETAQAEPPAPAPPPPPEPPSPSQPDPMAGHWVFDRQLGWLWLPENTTSVVIVPVIEVFPGGLITIHSGSRTATSRATRRNAAPPPTQLRRGSVIQHDAPGSMRKPATSPFPNKN
ncbi:MAG: hypothetical protein HZC54_00500 [Verrucomicrobia bacterium]|nr:hypothetical protein [Verrucomicrobiota bacterium]